MQNSTEAKIPLLKGQNFEDVQIDEQGGGVDQQNLQTEQIVENLGGSGVDGQRTSRQDLGNVQRGKLAGGGGADKQNPKNEQPSINFPEIIARANDFLSTAMKLIIIYGTFVGISFYAKKRMQVNAVTACSNATLNVEEQLESELACVMGGAISIIFSSFSVLVFLVVMIFLFKSFFRAFVLYQEVNQDVRRENKDQTIKNDQSQPNEEIELETQWVSENDDRTNEIGRSGPGDGSETDQSQPTEEIKPDTHRDQIRKHHKNLLDYAAEAFSFFALNILNKTLNFAESRKFRNLDKGKCRLGAAAYEITLVDNVFSDITDVLCLFFLGINLCVLGVWMYRRWKSYRRRNSAEIAGKP